MEQPEWTAAAIPEQTGRVAIITGATSGIGLATAAILAKRGASVILAVRNKTKGETALREIQREVPSATVSVLTLDLADLGSVKSFARTFKNSHSQLDLLINNAGVMIPPYSKTADGFELQFGTNHLGHFALTGLLIETIVHTPGSRVVTVSSTAHSLGNLNFDDLNWETRKYKAWRAYGDSKIANLYFTGELSRRLDQKNHRVLSTAAHPGWTATELQRHSPFISFMNQFLAQNIQMGALPTLRAAVDDTLTGGEFIGPDGFKQLRGHPIVVQSNERSHNESVARRVWEVSEKLTGVSFSMEC